MNLSDFDYYLPSSAIAQRPAVERANSRMLVLPRAENAVSQEWEDRQFQELPDLLRGDELVVVNNARVLPARLLGRRRNQEDSDQIHSGKVEILLTRQMEPDTWEALVKPGRKIREGERLIFGDRELEAEVIGRGEFGLRRLRFATIDHSGEAVRTKIEKLGHMPLPPYIDRPDDSTDRERYQTIFAKEAGAVAAPTAGLHFTPKIIERIKGRGAEVCEVTLHVGLGTFQPIHAEVVEEHRIHPESYEISAASQGAIAKAMQQKRPVLAVGTTVVRTLEEAARRGLLEGRTTGPEPIRAEADIFIFPGYEFRVVNQMLTNFHLPRSSLLILVSAFAGRENTLRAYRHAVESQYRFYSYGDCMLIR
ncbi:MAG: tRNA preQ1(34) S-adenosylmethionine ribosyltransferase-isomerase QueA [Acidobacteria bacterium]|nr:tRNA preQ1(34) S-adenosylmethionine ribosyltransferase-isomerase QueA [Acidobacteriota bacterium]